MVRVFHLLRLRLWPIFIRGSVLIAFVRMYISIKIGFNLLILIVVFVILNWFKDVRRERDFFVEHRSLNNIFFKIGIILFITSEVMFFVSFFWCYFDFVLVVDMELGRVWPPVGIERINPFSIPLLNTLILLSSGVLITWRHFRILINDWFYRVVTLGATLVLGVYFLVIQFQEYVDATYSFMRRGYGRIFFFSNRFSWFSCFIRLYFDFRKLISFHFTIMWQVLSL